MNTAASVMHAASTCNKVLDETVQIHGGMQATIAYKDIMIEVLPSGE